MTAKLVLASQSPRRAQLLTEAGLAHEVKPTNVDEQIPRRKMDLGAAAIEVATRKAMASTEKDAWVLAADTLLDVDGAVVGKPEDEVDAHAILRMLSGMTHAVFTGVAVRSPTGEIRTGHARTNVTFRELTDAEIDRYIRTGEPMDKAGAYAIQSGAKTFVSKVDGPIDNVVGLPMDVVRRLLRESGYPG